MGKKACLLPTPILPDGVLENILLRLPVRYVLTLKCVSRSWRSLISHPLFAKSHFDLTTVPTHRVLFKICNDSEAYSIDTEPPLHDDSASVLFNVPYPIPELADSVSVVGSCRGFILLTTPASDFNYFIIWNPSTGLEKRFNQVSRNCSYLCGIGYDSSTDDYVVVTVIFPPPRISGPLGTTEIHCFSSRNNSSWSCTEVTVPYIQMRDDFSHGFFLNEALHWLVYSYGDHHYKIVAFHVREKSLVEIPLPCGVEDQLCHLRVMGGCLSLCVDRNLEVEMWMMKEYKVHSSWTKSFVFSNLYPFDSFLPASFTKNGAIFGHNRRKTLMKFSHKGKLLEHSCAYELSMSNHRYSLLHYRESLLSLPDEYERLTSGGK